MKRASYDKQFKLAAIKMIIEDDISISSVSEELSIDYNKALVMLLLGIHQSELQKHQI